MRKPAVIGTFLVLCCVSLIFGAMSLQKLGEQTNNGKGVAIAIVVLIVLLGLGLGGQHKLRAIFILAIIVSILLQVIPNTSVIIEDTRPQRGGETREK